MNKWEKIKWEIEIDPEWKVENGIIETRSDEYLAELYFNNYRDFLEEPDICEKCFSFNIKYSVNFRCSDFYDTIQYFDRQYVNILDKTVEFNFWKGERAGCDWDWEFDIKKQENKFKYHNCHICNKYLKYSDRIAKYYKMFRDPVWRNPKYHSICPNCFEYNDIQEYRTRIKSNFYYRPWVELDKIQETILTKPFEIKYLDWNADAGTSIQEIKFIFSYLTVKDIVDRTFWIRAEDIIKCCKYLN